MPYDFNHWAEIEAECRGDDAPSPSMELLRNIGMSPKEFQPGLFSAGSVYDAKH